MKRLLSLLLCIIIAFSVLAMLASCGTPPPEEPPVVDGPEEGELPDDKEENKEKEDTKLEVPSYKDYERDTVSFSEIVYTRPKTAETVEKFNTVTALIDKNEISYDEQIEKITDLEDDFSLYLTMHTYANIKFNADCTDPFWSEEYSVTRLEYPEFSRAVEELFVAAARSPHADKFEEDYFGDDLVEEYADGGDYTDELVALMEDEARLESEYSSLSTATVKIVYQQYEDTLDNILKSIAEDHGEGSTQYSIAKKECARLYAAAASKKEREIFVELLKLRSKIADEYGYDSYSEVAYGEIYHDYTEEQFLKFAEDITKYILPVYARLNHFVFKPYFYTYTQEVELHPNTVVNTLYSVYKRTDEELADAYAYMLQYNLLDCAPPAEGRYEGAFSTYLESYNAPYLFATLDGEVSDLTTVAHEFGHFFDAYINYGDSTSLDLTEVSSTALELLTLNGLKDELSAGDYKYLLYSKLEEAMSAMIFQGFYGLFEHYAYSLDCDSITEERLVELMKSAAEAMGLDLSGATTIEAVLIPHVVLYPFYVQSYATSSAVALDIYYTELNAEGAGLKAYKELIAREDGDTPFENQLEDALLTSPFESKFLKTIADKIHYQLMGSHFFSQEENNQGDGVATA